MPCTDVMHIRVYSSEHLPENGAVKKITTNKVIPKASAMLRSAVVLLRKQEPGTTVKQARPNSWELLPVTTSVPNGPQFPSVAKWQDTLPFVKAVLPLLPEPAATSDVWQPDVTVAALMTRG